MTVALDLSGVARGNRPAGSIIDLDRLQRFPNYHHLPRSLPFSLTLLWDLPNVMSASEGGGRSWKSGRSEGGCEEFYIMNQFQMQTRGEGVKKIRIFVDVINGISLTN